VRARRSKRLLNDIPRIQLIPYAGPRCVLTSTPGAATTIPVIDGMCVSDVGVRTHCPDAPSVIHPSVTPIVEPAVTTRLNKAVWAKKLQDHPDQSFANQLLQYIDTGVPLLYKGPILKQIFPNWKSLEFDEEKVQTCMLYDVSKGWRVGPFSEPPFPNFVGSPMGAIYKPSKTRLIHDLSWPPGNSVNAYIPSDLCSVKYISVENAVSAVKLRGRGALKSKEDLKDAYKQIGVRIKDWPLL
jgi:hypothetical protein